jgi:hypothetical protein
MHVQVDRRKALMVLGRTALAVGSSGWVFFIWDKLAKLKENRVEIDALFPMWHDIQVIPGKHHPDYGYHPDTQAALERLTPLVPRSLPIHTAPADDLPTADLARDSVLIGGPVANPVSRHLYGYTFERGKLSIEPTVNTGLRWSFYYPYKGKDDPTFSRYVAGELHATMPKAVLDRRASRSSALPLFNKYDPETGLIDSDYLLLTVVPNTLLPYSTGSTVIDVASLQGQGEKVFADILRDNGRRKELSDAVHHRQYFQAFYELPVTHNSTKHETTPGVPRLRDVYILD